MADEELLFVRVSTSSKEVERESRDVIVHEHRKDKRRAEDEEPQDGTGQDHGVRKRDTPGNEPRKAQRQTNGHSIGSEDRHPASSDLGTSSPSSAGIPSLHSYYAALGSEVNKVSSQSRATAAPDGQDFSLNSCAIIVELDYGR